MDPEALAKTIAEQFVTVWNAPMPFLTAAIALWFALRWFIRGQFETRLANAQSTIEMLEKRIDRREAKTADAAEAALQQDIQTPPDLPPRDTSVPVLDPGPETPEKLVKLYQSHTKLQGAEAMKKYYGAVMTVTGSVHNVHEPNIDGSIMLSINRTDGDLLFCSFPEETGLLRNLRKGDKITVRGSLKVVDNSGVEITNCEIL